MQTGSNLGGSGSFSHGLQFVSKLEYDYIWLLDNDIGLDSLALSALIQTLQKHDEVGLVGSQIRKLHEPNTIQELGSFINSAKADLKTNFGNYSNISNEEILRGRAYIAVIKTIRQMWQIYWHIPSQQQMPKAIPTPLSLSVSIVICTSDRPNFLEKALKSLELIRYQNCDMSRWEYAKARQQVYSA